MTAKQRVEYTQRWIELVAGASDDPLADRITNLKVISQYALEWVRSLEASGAAQPPKPS